MHTYVQKCKQFQVPSIFVSYQVFVTRSRVNVCVWAIFNVKIRVTVFVSLRSIIVVKRTLYDFNCLYFLPEVMVTKRGEWTL